MKKSSIASIQNPPDYLGEWLEWKYSLTEKLERVAGKTYLNILNQIWVPPNAWDEQVLNLNELLFKRDVIISCAKNMCWMARTIIPQTTFNANVNFFSRLNHEPLGNLIHNNPNISRENLVFYSITDESAEFSWIVEHIHLKEAEVLWMRRSQFQLQKIYNFYLIEMFLPGLKKSLGAEIS